MRQQHPQPPLRATAFGVEIGSDGEGEEMATTAPPFYDPAPPPPL
jgi:hypothetical protein